MREERIHLCIKFLKLKSLFKSQAARFMGLVPKGCGGLRWFGMLIRVFIEFVSKMLLLGADLPKLTLRAWDSAARAREGFLMFGKFLANQAPVRKCFWV